MAPDHAGTRLAPAVTVAPQSVNGAYYLCLHPVILLLGSSPAAIRAPSAVAMAAAAGFTAALGRRLAAQAALPSPALTGLLAGLLVAAAPQATRYAQDARPYGIVTMLAAGASYLLVRSLADGRWRWWAGYGAALACAGLFNVFSLLLIVAHGISLLILKAAPHAAAAPVHGRAAGMGGDHPGPEASTARFPNRPGEDRADRAAAPGRLVARWCGRAPPVHAAAGQVAAELNGKPVTNDQGPDRCGQRSGP